MRRRFALADKVAVVTGAAQGIGLELTRGLRARGARVVMVDRDEDVLARAFAELGGGTVDTGLSIACADVTDASAMAEVAAGAIEDFGQIDLVIANAGVTPPPATIASGDPAEFARVLDINVTGVVNTVRPALAEIVRTSGHVVIVASSAAFCPGLGGSAYMASKAAAEQFGRALRLELAPHGASASVAYFGLVDTELARNTLDRDPLGARVGGLLPWPLSQRVTARRAADVVVRGIERRAPYTHVPRIWSVYSLLRGLINPVIDRMLIRDAEVATLVHDLDADWTPGRARSAHD